jgi:hypothetical protein
VNDTRRHRRLVIAAAAATALVVGAVALGGAAGVRPGGLQARYAYAQNALSAMQADKNAISRAGNLGKSTKDPTTAADRVAAASYVERERRLADPKLTSVRVTQPRAARPQDRYAMAGGCYSLAGTPIFFEPTDLGDYLLYDATRKFVTAGGNRAGAPGRTTVWTARKSGNRFTFLNNGSPLTIGGANSFALVRTTGCAAYPESQIDVSGRPHAGVTPYQEVRGYVDAHTHGMAFEFLGGAAHCGKPWDAYGAPYALVDCPDHTATGGYGGVLESVLSGQPNHDPVGWPTFKDWPAPESLTHEGTYYRWLERAWRGGQRVLVNLLVENNKLCQIYPLKRSAEYAQCDDMVTVRREARDMYEMQDYIDAQSGGPGKGFYRIVKTPFEARKVINAGKLAVVMGMETSVPFGCTMKLDVPQCDIGDIDSQLDQLKQLGVRQVELVNKFDNALSGVAGDVGAVGVAVNAANFLETGSFWDMRHCEPADGESHDRDQVALPSTPGNEISAQQQDALLGAVGQLFDTLHTALPLYGPAHHCNSRGLTTLGEHTIAGLAKRHMVFDPDHMSVKARASALDQIEDLGYPGVVSSHSWSTPDAYPRIYQEGGFITPYAGDSTGFVEKWRTHIGWADKRYYWGIGYGADMNGLGAQGDPLGGDVANPVTYPFKGLAGVTVAKQRAGERVYDVNVDGVAQYGLYPDWIQDLTKVADTQKRGDGAKIEDDLARGAEAYLQMWERAEGIAPDSCRNPGLRKRVTKVEALVHRGMTTRAVMRAVGQPYTRLGSAYGFCAKTGADPKVMMKVTFSKAGKVVGIRRT